VNNKILIIVLALIAGLGVTGTGLYMTGILGGNEGGEAPRRSVDDRPFSYVEVPSVVANFMFQGNMRYAQITVSIQTRDEESAKLLDQNIPLVRSAMLSLLSEFDYGELATAAGKAKLLEQIGYEIENASFGGGTSIEFDQVILTGFVVQ